MDIAGIGDIHKRHVPAVHLKRGTDSFYGIGNPGPEIVHILDLLSVVRTAPATSTTHNRFLRY
jgi:hypothetical protein